MENLILGVGTGYRASVFRRFLGSLRRTGSRSSVGVFLSSSDLTPEIIGIFKEAEAQPLILPHTTINIQSARFRVYLEYLAAVSENTRVLITDVRDVLFQRDPFSSFESESLLLCQEERTIGECPINSQWIREGYGDEISSKISAQRILCSGTTFGRGAALRNYLTLMTRELERIHSHGDPSVGIDQGVHNVLFYTGKLLGGVARCEINGPVVTLKYGSQRINDNLEIVTQGGRVPPVAHQIDRLPFQALKAMGRKLQLPMDDCVVESIKYSFEG